MISQQNIVLKKYLKSVLEFCILPIPKHFLDGNINQFAVPLSKNQRILFEFFAEKEDDTISIKLSLEEKNINDSYFPVSITNHIFSDDADISSIVNFCIDEFCNKL